MVERRQVIMQFAGAFPQTWEDPEYSDPVAGNYTVRHPPSLVGGSVRSYGRRRADCPTTQLRPVSYVAASLDICCRHMIRDSVDVGGQRFWKELITHWAAGSRSGNALTHRMTKKRNDPTDVVDAPSGTLRCGRGIDNTQLEEVCESTLLLQGENDATDASDISSRTLRHIWGRIQFCDVKLPPKAEA